MNLSKLKRYKYHEGGNFSRSFHVWLYQYELTSDLKSLMYAISVCSPIKPPSRLCIQTTGCALLKSLSKMSQVSSYS